MQKSCPCIFRSTRVSFSKTLFHIFHYLSSYFYYFFFFFFFEFQCMLSKTILHHIKFFFVALPFLSCVKTDTECSAMLIVSRLVGAPGGTVAIYSCIIICLCSVGR